MSVIIFSVFPPLRPHPLPAKYQPSIPDLSIQDVRKYGAEATEHSGSGVRGVARLPSRCVCRMEHDASETPYKQEGKEREAHQRQGKRPDIEYGITVEGAVDIEQIIVAQRE